jgi:N-acylneuraminate cytidylyltransferase
MRPLDLAGDEVSTKAVTRHAVQWYRDAGQVVDFACCIYATAPFLQASFLREALDFLVTSGKHFVFSVTSFPFPAQRGLRINARGCLEVIYPEYIDMRSRDLPETYHDAGQFYWGRAEAYLNNDRIFSALSRPYILPRHLVQDIDTLEDWRRAELMYQVMQLDGSIANIGAESTAAGIVRGGRS